MVITAAQKERLTNTRVESIQPILAPIELKERIPSTYETAELVINTRQEISDILQGVDKHRLLLIVGPCSLHDPKEAMEYAERLAVIRKQVEDDLLIVMRTYVEKPRTTVGWTGLAYVVPHLDGEPEISGVGLILSRQILADVNKLGVPCGVEVLDPITPQYLDDFVSWAAVGARTTTSQPHRQLISAYSSPVGYKNTTEGSIKLAVDGIETSTHPHQFYSIDDHGRVAEVRSTGNRDTHIVLRGGEKGTNYDAATIKNTLVMIDERGLLDESSRPAMIDCSHDNSAEKQGDKLIKVYTNQLTVAENVSEQFRSGQRRIMGMMFESNLIAGAQKFIEGKPLERGKSITDACLGWNDTESLIFKVARAISPKKYILA